MRTSLDELKKIEAYLRGTLSGAEALVFNAKLLISPALRRDVAWVEETLTYIDAFGRRKIRSEIAHVQNVIFTDPRYADLRQSIKEIF